MGTILKTMFVVAVGTYIAYEWTMRRSRKAINETHTVTGRIETSPTI